MTPDYHRLGTPYLTPLQYVPPPKGRNATTVLKLDAWPEYVEVNETRECCDYFRLR